MDRKELHDIVDELMDKEGKEIFYYYTKREVLCYIIISFLCGIAVTMGVYKIAWGC